MSFAFNFSDSQFSAPELNAPRPCAHAANCYYNGPNGCAFVHPGEEGTGMKIFHARVMKDQQTGKEMWQKATVRLIGGAGFYERRRLKMSWPAWCALPKNSHLQKPVKGSPPAKEQEKEKVQEYVAPFTQPAQSQDGMLHKMIAQAEAQTRQNIGNALYPIINAFLAEEESSMKAGGVWHPSMTAGKITGMLLEGFSCNDLYQMMTDMASLTDNLAQCCDILKAHGERKAQLVA
jgi:hypothetical protein